MRNLRNIGHGVFRAPSAISASCWDAARDEILVTYGPTADAASIELVRLSRDASPPSSLQARTVASWDAPSPTENGHVDIIRSLHHCSDTLTTCVILAGGDIVTVVEDEDGATAGEPSGAHVEIVGTLQPSIVAARWSPDEELLVIVTGDDKVVFMSRSFDVITETAVTADDLKASKHVSVGWGKKETQFHGRGAKAKALRDPTIPEKVDEGLFSPNDDGRCTVSWRGDGAFVAINLHQEQPRRVIRVYNRDGELDSVSEPVDGLEGSLSWRPAGNLMAGIQRLPDRVDVVFFERNGLRHGQFTLRAPQDAPGAMEHLALEWNSDSSVLAVTMRDRVQLWTTGNYHWYLKQEVHCGQHQPHVDGSLEQQTLQFSWHAEKPLLFATAVAGNVLLNEFVFSVSRGPTAAPNDYGAVAVIDGPTIKFTPFRTANIPPPIAMYELEVESPVIDVAFTKDGFAMAVLHRLGVNIYGLEANAARLSCPKLQEKAVFPILDSEFYEESFLQVEFAGPQEVQVLRMAEDVDLISYHVGASSQENKWSETPAGLISTITSPDNSSPDGIVAQDRQGRLSLVSGGEHVNLPIGFPTLLPWASFVTHDGKLLGFGLSRNGHLYANSRQLAKNCTSFIVTGSHLIFTTSNHLVKFVHLASPKDLDVPQDDPENDERCRSIERGARLVTAMPANMSMVLQMPRGNLETIFPRAMVVAGIRQLIEQKEYGAAFTTCRTQRVDMNILYDHRPAQFLINVGLFLDQVKETANIDLFLSTLKEEDVSKTMYRDTKPAAGQALPDSEIQAPGKVNTVCDAVLQRLRTQKNANLQNIITAHVCKSPPALEDGLLVVADLMREDEALAERAVEHICFLVDVNKLFDHALGLYNLDLTLLVAQQSQRDPREYLPFIQGLHKMSKLKRQFTIDDKLGYGEKALGHLKALGNFEDVQNYVVKHKLYQYALGLYRLEEQHHIALIDLYAAYLKSTSLFREAGLAYESLGNFADATECYLKGGAACWRECLYVAQQQEPPISSEKLQEIASDLADALRESKDYAAAAAIHVEYLASIETAIQFLGKGYLFADALRLVALHKRADLLESAVDTGLAEAFSSSTEFLADCKAQLKAQVPRIAELRKKAREDPLSFYEGENPYSRDGMDIPDDVSVAASSRMSTGVSLFTRYTGKGGSVGTVGSNVSRATSKNRKREEKKRARGRKGTVYEEEYLVNSVRRLVERVEASKAEVERLVFGLARRNMAERARTVEDLVAQVVDACRLAVKEVWQQQEQQQDGPGDGQPAGDAVATGDGGAHEAAAGYRPTGGQAVFHESLEAAKTRQQPPVVSDLARLVLLGGSK
ncbi:IKI3 family-domain-containing protein [Lasiosphaeria miniovina]|uniref:Elongator complex protein 1 n=1 Tax=Lasiosphaeria miniovina TaxID=1954250 RepID=A0AA40DNJ6_9PEZI|nr:IKI3 family-domain-containing protein [Lasiosphaeria miniovina]KAK0706398.1 IKI3 family-domain-containing protein [Lasiosphaeria miniovina]